jgi:ABC-type sulfate/molybdate transport systems ATPase subunit
LSDPSTTALQPHHRLSVDAHLGPLHLLARLHFAAPWTVIFGPSGSGKSSLLRAACGLLHTALVEFSERSTSSADWLEIQGRHHTTPVHLRSIGYAPQGAVLFPHLSIRENIAFASQARHSPDAQSITAAIDLFELGALAHRMPRDLSGGERQRVNLARAFAVPAARLLLLDEPFTGVDRGLRDTLLPRMHRRATQLGVPVISVTHDVEEALLLGAEVIRLESGHITAQGPAHEVLATERISILQALSVD